MKPLWWTGLAACVFVLSAGTAVAGSSAQTSDVQASMLIKGTIAINTDGSVAGYTLHDPGQLPKGVLEEMAKAVPQWKFQPVLRDGKAVRAKSVMHVRLVVKPAGGGKFGISVAGAYFGNAAKSTTTVSEKHVFPPRYPRYDDFVPGTVYLMLKIGRDGKVQHVAARQVDLGIQGSATQMKQWRQVLTQVSTKAARQWTFTPPVQGPRAADAYWVVSIPMNFRRRGRHVSRYGQWQAYIPGPVHFIPWLDQHELAAESADAMPADGGLYPARQSLHLLTHLRSGS
ncbi:MAG TPA: energy transducer TonB [Rhodanobacteraceae bacterium]